MALSSAARQSVAAIVPVIVWPNAIGVAGQATTKLRASSPRVAALKSCAGGENVNPVRLGVARWAADVAKTVWLQKPEASVTKGVGAVPGVVLTNVTGTRAIPTPLFVTKPEAKNVPGAGPSVSV